VTLTDRTGVSLVGACQTLAEQSTYPRSTNPAMHATYLSTLHTYCIQVGIPLRERLAIPLRSRPLTLGLCRTRAVHVILNRCSVGAQGWGLA
jgi:hypothetical protein